MSMSRRTLITAAASSSVVPALPAAAAKTAASVPIPAAVPRMTDAEMTARFRYLFGLFDKDGQRAITGLLKRLVEAQQAEEAAFEAFSSEIRIQAGRTRQRSAVQV